MKLAMSPREAAREAGVSFNAIYDAVNGGKLKMRKLGRRSIIMHDDLRAWVEALPVCPPEKKFPNDAQS